MMIMIMIELGVDFFNRFFTCVASLYLLLCDIPVTTPTTTPTTTVRF